MKDEKFKKLVIRGPVAAFLLLVSLLVFQINQITALSQRRERIEYLQGEIARYEQIIASTEDEIEKYQARYWLEQRAAELDMILKNQ